MKRSLLMFFAMGLGAFGCFKAKADLAKMKEAPVDGGKIYGFKMKDIDGKEHSLGDYKGKVLVLVNTASMCGNTPQYESLEKTYEKMHKDGLEILGFPANNFGQQEPGTDKEIKEFCTKNYAVTFPMFSKISVKGADIHPLYKYLTEETDFKGDIDWNFAKFIVNREGRVVARIPAWNPIDSADSMKALKAAF
jgi:glutathione peroxidase